MSCGPAMVAIRRRPRPIRCSTACARAAGVVDVDVAAARSTSERAGRRGRPAGRARRAARAAGRRRAARAAAPRRRAGRSGSARPAGPLARRTAPSPAPAAARGRPSAGADAADDAGEERLAEDPLLRLRHDQGDRVGAPGDQRCGPPGWARTRARRPPGRPPRGPLGLTCGEPLITRETVPRQTPARAATSSRVRSAAGQPLVSSCRRRPAVSAQYRRALPARTSAYQRALSLSVRCWVA